MKKAFIIISCFVLQISVTAQTFTGPVGIGTTTTPGAQLEVRNGAIRISNSTDNKSWDFNYDVVGKYFYIDEYGASRRLAIANGGNVGIGTTIPQNLLQVNGSANFTGATTIGTNSIGGTGSYGLLYSNRGNQWTEIAIHSQGFGAMLYANPQGAQYPGMWETQFPGYTAGLIANPSTPLVFGVGAEKMRISLEGKLGIGTVVPPSKLSISGPSGVLNNVASQTNITNFNGDNGIRMISTSGINSQDGIMYQSGANGGGAGIAFGRGGSWDTFMSFYTNSNTNGSPGNIIERMRIDGNGNVGIGTTNPGNYMLAVKGSAIFTKVQVKAASTPWPDYVFNPAYELRSLSSLESYINEYKHLPDVPSAKEVEDNGVDLGATQAALLRKIEELTLYVIAQHKQLEVQNKKIETLQKKSTQRK